MTGIQFNGNVTINGNVEMFSNGSMKIVSNQLNINIKDLVNFIKENLKYSPNVNEYIQAAEDIQKSKEPSILKRAIQKIKELGSELGKNILITGLSNVVLDALKSTLTS